ncbi:MAG: hypothetical protein V4697_03485 [Patescibacteria group bacterium]
MKKYIITTLLILTILLGGVVLLPHQAEADGASWLSILALVTGGPSAAEAITGNFWESVFSQIGELALRMSSYVLTLSGVILNMSVALTMNIKAIYQATPAIEQVWVVIRNISSIFIIFALVYISIRKILNVDSPSLGTMIKNIVIAGLLINFSLFFTRVLIDGSNLISMQFYRAIAPRSQNVSLTDKGSISGLLANSFTDGGISDVFMQSLKLPKIYNNGKGVFAAGEGGTSFKILIASALGSVLMIVAALSFFAAAIAFIIRLVILLLLMGFSPVFFVGMIFPDVQKNISGKWWGWLEQQLIFMPIYLLFMYVALRFINGATPGEGFFAALDGAQVNAGQAANGGWLLSTIGLVLQYTIAFILINIPLFAAQQTGGISVKWGTQAKDWVRGKIGSGAKAGFGFGAQHVVGRGAKFVQDKVASSEWATTNPNLAVLTNKSLNKVSGATFGGSKGGYDKRFKEYAKARQDFAKELKTPESMQGSFVATKIGEWDSNMTKERARMALELGEVKKQKANYTRILQTGSPDQQELALNKLKEIEAEEKKLTEKLGKGTAELREKELGKLKKEAENVRAEAFAKNLGSSSNPFSKKADKKAAKDILKSLTKGKKDKALDAFKEFFEEAEGAAGKGGEEKKAEKE